MLAEDEIQELISDLRAWPASGRSFDGEGEPWEWMIGLSASLYFHAPVESILERRRAAVELWREFQSLIGNRLTHVEHPKTGRLHKIESVKLPDFMEFAVQWPVDEPFHIESADTANEATSPDYAFRVGIKGHWEEVPFKVSYFRIDFNYRWWKQNVGVVRQFLLKAATLLQAEQGYMGFGFVSPLGVGAVGDFLEYEKPLAKHFYGYHFDKPFFMVSPHRESRPLTFGMNAVTWGTLIGTRWLEKAGGKDAIRAQLTHPRIRVDELPDALWIEAGDEPGLLPVEAGIPPIYRQIAKALKPARADELDFLTLGQWDDDDRDVMSPQDSRAWLARFDDDGTWPDAAVRFWQPDPEAPMP